jgi:hypothetical protein
VQTRQVVILQCVDRFGEIEWQRYFYGGSDAVGIARYRCATNARAISVWAGATPAATRIAICGEQNDDVLPLSQDPQGWVASPATMVPRPFSGFIAVYDGAGNLLWTHHFFGSQPATLLTQTFDCAITDVSMRVEGAGELQRDVVTYCGISELGNPVAGNAWLTPVRPFVSPGAGLSDGTTNFGVADGAFDGMVGRLTRTQNYNISTTTTEFHSVVAGSGSDGLFGIAELENERFVVVGSTTNELPVAIASFPFTLTVGPPSGTFYRCATLLGFNALPTLTGGALVLEFATPLGTRGEHAPPIVAGTGKNSIARDVFVHLDGGPPGQNAIDVVGATDDPQFFSSLTGGFVVSPSMSTFDVGATPAGVVPPSEGFYLGLWESAGSYSFASNRDGGFIGGPGVDGLTGVAAWNEYTDQVKFCGYTLPGAEIGNADILVGSLMVGATGGYVTQVLRRTQVGGGGEDLPTVMGRQSIHFETGLGPTFSHGSHAGGGIAVDERARTTVVGATLSLDYPVTSAAFQPLYGVPRAPQVVQAPPLGPARDAVRTEFDLIPEGVGRTDGTGSTWGPLPASLPPAGTTGGTTPVAALLQFGRRVGEVPLLRRTLVEFQGDNRVSPTPPPTPAAVVFTRPSTNAVVLGTVLQFGFPLLSPVTLDGVDYWLFDTTATLWLDLWSPSPWSWRFEFTVPLGSVGGTEISAQLISLVTCDPSTWQGSICSPNPIFSTDMTLVGSPALFLQFQ